MVCTYNIEYSTYTCQHYNAHVYLLGPLVRQINIREQFYVRNYRFLWNAFRSRNHIVSTCMNMALDNSNTCIGYNLAFYRYRYNIGMYSNINSSIKLLSASNTIPWFTKPNDAVVMVV